MSRTLTSGILAAIQESQITALLFVELNFASGFLRLTTAGHDITWSGFTWLGVAKIGQVEAIVEDTRLQANGYRMSLSGLDADVISIALQEDYQGRSAKIWLAMIDSLGAIIADPLLIVTARMDHMEVIYGSVATVTLYVESEMAAWARPKVRRYTDADQKSEFPADRGFEFVSESATRTISWGRG